jgi:hypothetical protein
VLRAILLMALLATSCGSPKPAASDLVGGAEGSNAAIPLVFRSLSAAEVTTSLGSRSAVGRAMEAATGSLPSSAARWDGQGATAIAIELQRVASERFAAAYIAELQGTSGRGGPQVATIDYAPPDLPDGVIIAFTVGGSPSGVVGTLQVGDTRYIVEATRRPEVVSLAERIPR